MLENRLQRKPSKPVSHSVANNVAQRMPNKTGLPDHLKSGIENLSGHSMDDVKVHYNSSKPSQLQAHAYAQGNQIHLAPGQEKHLPHEAWHVVQQKQGRVRPTMQFQSKVNINDDAGLEKEADVMGTKAGSMTWQESKELKRTSDKSSNQVNQRKVLFGAHEVGSMQEVAMEQHFWNFYTHYMTAGQKALFRQLLPEKHAFNLRRIVPQVGLNFNATSGEHVNGIYHDEAAGNEASSLQSRDAEVAILQRVDDAIHQDMFLEHLSEHINLYIKISKGPCDSCRSLINMFRRRFPQIRIVIQYSQAIPKVKEQAGKDRGQKALSYGYEDAVTVGHNRHIKVHPNHEVQTPQKVPGYSSATLKGMADRFIHAHGFNTEKIPEFVAHINNAMINKESDRQLLIDWLGDKIPLERQLRVDDNDRNELGSIPHPAGGAQVQAHARLTYLF